MFDIGFFEMFLIAVVALVVMGPEKFPGFAKMAVRTFRDLKGYMNEVKTEVAKELNPVKSELDKITRETPESFLDKLTADDSTSRDEFKDEDEYCSDYMDGDGYSEESAYTEAQTGEEHRDDFGEEQSYSDPWNAEQFIDDEPETARVDTPEPEPVAETVEQEDAPADAGEEADDVPIEEPERLDG